MEEIVKYAVKRHRRIEAFTLAEVLITLVIIGVVAALTIPSVIINYKNTMYVTQLKKEYNYIQNALKVAMAKDGVTKLTDTKLLSMGSITHNALNNNAKQREEFSKIFNVVAIYDPSKNPLPVENKKIAYKYLNGNGSGNSSGSNVHNEFICLADGACIKIGIQKNVMDYYYPSCGDHNCASLREYQQYKNTPAKLFLVVGSVYIDVNGFKKGPNQYGRDFFGFSIGDDGSLYPFGGIDVATAGKSGCAYSSVSENTCSSYWRYNNNTGCNSSGTGEQCAARIIEESWKMNY